MGIGVGGLLGGWVRYFSCGCCCCVARGRGCEMRHYWPSVEGVLRFHAHVSPSSLVLSFSRQKDGPGARVADCHGAVRR